MTEKFKVRDGSRIIEFEGTLLSEVSSKRRGSPRWTDLRLYRTGSGVFVLEKVGASVVLHAPGCPEIMPGVKLPRFQAEHPGSDPADDEWWWCETCSNEADDMTSLLVESNRHWAIISETPQEVIDALYRRRGGARTMPRMCMVLLEEAGERDSVIQRAYQSEVLV